MYIQSAQNQLSSHSNEAHSGFDQKIDIWNSECGITIAMNIPMKLRNPVWNFSWRGNSRLEFGKAITNHLKCELLSTNKQKWWVDEIKHFHSQNEKKDEKTGKNKKDAELLSYRIWIPVPFLDEKIKACQSLLRKPPKLTS